MHDAVKCRTSAGIGTGRPAPSMWAQRRACPSRSRARHVLIEVPRLCSVTGPVDEKAASTRLREATTTYH